MTRPLAFVVALAGVAAAQSIIVNVVARTTKGVPWMGTVMEVRSSLTTISVECDYRKVDGLCDLIPKGGTLILGPSTQHLQMSSLDPDDEKRNIASTEDCKIDLAANTAVCSGDLTAYFVEKGKSTASNDYTLSPASKYIFPFTISKGLENLTAAPGAKPTGDDTDVAPTATATSASSLTNVSGSAGASKTTSAVTTSSTSNAAGPAATQNAVFAGCVAVAGVALAL